MKIISLWAPWAHLWAGGQKKIETRSWPLKAAFPLTMAVHAAKHFTAAERDLCRHEPFRSALAAIGYGGPDDLPLGCVVGAVRIVDCYRFGPPVSPPPEPERSFGDYCGGRFGWVTDGNKLLATPVPLVGRQGIWEWEPPAGVRWVERVTPPAETPAPPRPVQTNLFGDEPRVRVFR